MGKRNLISGLSKVDWSDPQRQNEFVNSVVSALNGIGAHLSYDEVCAVSGSAFRTSFSMPSAERWNHGNYHAVHTPAIIEHTFRMLGYRVSQHIRGSYEADKKLIVDSIDRDVPAITLEGVINCADACIITGYDDGGDVLLGYSPFMDSQEDHREAHDISGYFRKSTWHEGFFASGSMGRILIIEGAGERMSREEVQTRTLALVKQLILEESLVPGQYNGLAAHWAFANALRTYGWEDPFEPYLNVMCNYKQYLDRQYAVEFLRACGREELASCYEQIAELVRLMGRQIPQDFSAGELFSGDRSKLEPYCNTVLEISKIEKEAADLI